MDQFNNYDTELFTRDRPGRSTENDKIICVNLISDDEDSDEVNDQQQCYTPLIPKQVKTEKCNSPRQSPKSTGDCHTTLIQSSSSKEADKFIETSSNNNENFDHNYAINFANACASPKRMKFDENAELTSPEKNEMNKSGIEMIRDNYDDSDCEDATIRHIFDLYASDNGSNIPWPQNEMKYMGNVEQNIHSSQSLNESSNVTAACATLVDPTTNFVANVTHEITLPINGNDTTFFENVHQNDNHTR